MESIDVMLLSIMWACLGIALTLSLGICALISCRRVLLVKSFKTQADQNQVVPQQTETHGTLETFPDHGPISAEHLGKVKRAGGRYWQEKKVGLDRRSYDEPRVTTNIDDVPCHTENDDIYASHAFNTEDVLKQEVNPTHAVNPALFKDSAREVNTSRTLVEKSKHQYTPADYEFNTPNVSNRDMGKVREFSGNKENEIFGPGKDSSPVTTVEMGHPFQASIKALAGIEKMPPVKASHDLLKGTSAFEVGERGDDKQTT